MRNNKGVVLIASYLTIAVLLVLGTAIGSRTVSEGRIAQADKQSVLAFNLAEAGIDRGFRWLSDQPSPPAGTAAFDLFVGTQALGQGSYRVGIDPADTNPTSYIKRYDIRAQGTVGTISSRQLVVTVQLASFSRYAYFSNAERTITGTRVWFITGDRLEGPVHTNGQFNISGNPTFVDLVTSTSTSINYMNGGPPNDNPDFQSGTQLGAESINLPVNLQPLRDIAATGGLVLNGASTIELLSNGTMNVTNQQRGWTNRNVPLPSNGVVYVEGGGLNLAGTLKGQLTIGSNQDIVITNNITYNTDPVSNPNSTDVLGIASQRNVMVSSSAPYNMTIQASVMALGASFGVQNYQIGPAKGTLSVYGGIIQKNRGPVGTFNSRTGQRLSGYQKNYRYDNRLRGTLSPPYFPVITTSTGYRYNTISWTEQ